MPRVTYLNNPANRIAKAVAECRKLDKVLKGYANARQVSEKGFDNLRETQARYKLKNVEKMTLEELIQICVSFEIPNKDVISKIHWYVTEELEGGLNERSKRNALP